MDPVTQLAIEARSGDARAIAAFVRATQQDVWRLCSLVGRRGEADDLTQETFLRALAALGQFRGESPAKVWLAGIARRTCADDLRRNYRSRRLVDRLVSEHLAGQRQSDRTPSGVTALLDGLDTERRTAFVMTQMLGLSYEEAAEACEVPVGTIRSRVARARAQLVAEVREAEAL